MPTSGNKHPEEGDTFEVVVTTAPGSGSCGRVQSTHLDRSNRQKSEDLTGKERFAKENSWTPKIRGTQSSRGKKKKRDSRSQKIRIKGQHVGIRYGKISSKFSSIRSKRKMPKKKGAKRKKGAKEKKNNEESPRSIVNMQEKVSRTSRRSNAILKEKVSRTSGRSNVSNGSTEQGTPSASTLDSLELAENLSRQILSMQKVQNQLLDRISNMDLNQMQMATCLENFGLMFQEAAENKKLAEKSSQSVMDSKDQEGVVKMLESSSPVLQESENLSQPALGSVQQLTSPIQNRQSKIS
ncbi:unnamed protein product [Caenorhabditis nigoni]